MKYDEFETLLTTRAVLMGTFSEPTQYTNLPKEHLLSYLKDKKHQCAQLARRIDRMIHTRLQDLALFSTALSKVVDLEEEQMNALYRQYSSLYISPGREFSEFSIPALRRIVEVALETATND